MKSPTHPLTADLVASLGATNVLEDDAAIAPFRRDKSPYPEIDPGVVVTPGSVDELAQVLRLANSRRNPVIVRGAGFSMTGFLQRAPHEAIVVDTRRLNRVIEVDEVDMTVTAEAGVIMSDLEAQVAARGFEVQTVALPTKETTLGGVLSGVVGGGLPRDAGATGTTGRNVVDLKVLLADGTLLQCGAGGGNVNRRASAIPGGDGPFLTGLFLGDGGSLGVKVEATLQITPAAPHVASAQWHFADLDGVWQVLAQIAAIRETPYTGIAVAEGPPWVMNFTTRASDPDVLDSYVRRTERVLAACGGQPKAADATAVPNRDWFINVDRAVVAFIFGRSAFLQAFQRIRTTLDERIRERQLADLGIALKVVIYPHTRHAMYTSVSILFDRNVQGGRARAVELATETYEHVVALGGYLEPHQGAASRVIADSWSPEYRRAFQGLKSALDPNNILNPGLWGVE